MARLRKGRVVLASALVALAASATWVLVGAWSGDAASPSAALRCLAVRCTGDVVGCASDPECKAWLECIQECGDDKMKCPTFCGAFYQSPRANAFTRCALANRCIALDFSSFPACGAPAAPPVELGRVDGTWWVVGIAGPDYVLFDDCQKFVLEQVGPGEVRATNSVPLTRRGETRVCVNRGRYTRTPAGGMQLAYENYVGYHEDWHFAFRTENTLLAHVCSAASTARSMEYGTFVLSRAPLASLGAEERTALEAALRSLFHLEPGAVTPLRSTGCANQ